MHPGRHPKYVRVEAQGPDAPRDDRFPIVYNENEEKGKWIASTESQERIKEENSYTWRIMKFLVAILCLLLVLQVIRAQVEKQKRLKFQAHPAEFGQVDVSNILSKMAIQDTNGAQSGDIEVDYQNMASHHDFGHDNAPYPFFKSVNPALLQKVTYQALTQLLAVYTTSDIDTPDTTMTTNSQLVNAFISSVSLTKVYTSGINFLIQNNIVTANSVTQTLKDLWFNPYAINSVKGSSGFKHVFAGASEGINVLGLNNWVRFYTLEQAGNVNYHGWFARQEYVTISMQFGWGTTPLQAMMQNFTVGTSPEFDFVAYTICALSTPDAGIKVCTYQNAGFTITLEVETINDNGVQRIKHASPYVGHLSGNPTVGPNPTGAGPNPTSGGNIGSFQQLVDSMRAADVDRAQPGNITLDWGTNLRMESRKKRSGGQLFAHVNEALFQRPVYAQLINIYNNKLFDPQVCDQETPISGLKKQLLDQYMRTLTNTTVFQLAYQYLVSNGAASSDWNTFYTNLFNLWYGTYSRCRSTGAEGSSGRNKHHAPASSGWEHVYSGEWKGSEVDGQHNWVRYYLEQKAGNIDYKGYYSHEGDLIGTWEYYWQSYKKPKGGFFIGTSPAFDLAVFTSCVYTHQGSGKCAFQMDGQYNIYITSYDQQCDAGTCLSTSYPSDTK